jgi:hypothetical protein
LSYYPDEGRLLPTRLGNTLRAAEDEAGMRYGLPTVVTMPRLYPYLSERFAAVYVNRRNQLDAVVCYCAILALAATIDLHLFDLLKTLHYPLPVRQPRG